MNHRYLFFIVLAIAGMIYSQARIWEHSVWHDSANWDYFSQVIARGGVPYRDVVNIKSPLSAYISAAAIVTARPFGLRDVIAIRLVYIFLAALTVSFTFLVAYYYFRSRRIALLAASIMLAFNLFATSNASGTQPKTPMVLFGLIALCAIIKDRPFIAGMFGMLSMLSWQPGLLFAGVAGLAFSRYLTRWRDGKAVKMIAGAAVPLAVLLAYFWAAGALRDFYLWCFHYNYTVYAPREARSLSGLLQQLNRVTQRWFAPEIIYFYLAAAGVFIASVREGIRAKSNGIKSLLDAATHHAILIAALIYVAFCMINIQGGPDLFPILPFVGIFAAVAMVFALDGAAHVIERLRTPLRPAGFKVGSFILVLALAFYWSVADISSFKVRGATLQDQDKDVAEIVSHLQPGDKIFVHGQTEVLVLAGLPNASKYFFLDRGKDNYLDKTEPGGFDGWLGRLKAEQPKVVVLSRMRPVDQAKKFQLLVETEYERRDTTTITYYLRKTAEVKE